MSRGIIVGNKLNVYIRDQLTFYESLRATTPALGGHRVPAAMTPHILEPVSGTAVVREKSVHKNRQLASFGQWALVWGPFTADTSL